jgi:hypothetical protein
MEELSKELLCKKKMAHLHLSLLCSTKDKLVNYLMWKIVPSDVSPTHP